MGIYRKIFTPSVVLVLDFFIKQKYSFPFNCLCECVELYFLPLAVNFNNRCTFQRNNYKGKGVSRVAYKPITWKIFICVQNEITSFLVSQSLPEASGFLYCAYTTPTGFTWFACHCFARKRDGNSRENNYVHYYNFHRWRSKCGK